LDEVLGLQHLQLPGKHARADPSERPAEFLEAHGSKVVEDHHDFDAPLPEYHAGDFEVLAQEDGSVIPARRDDVRDVARKAGRIGSKRLKAFPQVLRIRGNPPIATSPRKGLRPLIVSVLILSRGIGSVPPDRDGQRRYCSLLQVAD
jgi:hypothetical protein